MSETTGTRDVHAHVRDASARATGTHRAETPGFEPPGSDTGLRARWRRLPAGWRLALPFWAVFAIPPGLLLVATGALTGRSSGDLLWAVLVYEGKVALASLLFAASTGLWHVLAATHLGRRPAGDMSPRQDRSVFVSAAPSAVTPVLRAALEGLKLKGAVVDARGGLRLEARIGMDAIRFASTVTVDLEAARGGTLVRIASRPDLPTVQSDGGRARDDVEHVVAALLAAFPARVDAPAS